MFFIILIQWLLEARAEICKIFCWLSGVCEEKKKYSEINWQWGFSVTRFDYTGAKKSCDQLVENSFVKKNPLQDLLSSLNVVISTNERTWIYKGSHDF